MESKRKIETTRFHRVKFDLMEAANLIKLSPRATCDAPLKRKPWCFPSCQDGSQPVETVPSYYSKSGGGSIGAHNRWSYKRGSGAIKTPSSIRKVAAKRALPRASIRRGDIFDELSASARKTNDANRRARKRKRGWFDSPPFSLLSSISSPRNFDSRSIFPFSVLRIRSYRLLAFQYRGFLHRFRLSSFARLHKERGYLSRFWLLGSCKGMFFFFSFSFVLDTRANSLGFDRVKKRVGKKREEVWFNFIDDSTFARENIGEAE